MAGRALGFDIGMAQYNFTGHDQRLNCLSSSWHACDQG